MDHCTLGRKAEYNRCAFVSLRPVAGFNATQAIPSRREKLLWNGANGWDVLVRGNPWGWIRMYFRGRRRALFNRYEVKKESARATNLKSTFFTGKLYLHYIYA